MPILHVRNVPDALYDRIRQQAAANNRSISAEVVTLLQRAVNAPERTQAEILEEIRRNRSFSPAVVGAPDSTTMLREDRER
jgi:plasmid stability protein